MPIDHVLPHDLDDLYGEGAEQAEMADLHSGEIVVTVHVSPDCQPETLRALSEMMQLLIKQIAGQSNTGLHSDGAVRCANCGYILHPLNGICPKCGVARPAGKA